MSSHDAQVQEIEVLYHFASSIGHAGSSIASAATHLAVAAYQERGEFRSLLDRIESNLETAQREYSEALSEWEEDENVYTEQALYEARERLNEAQENYEEGLTIYQLVDPLLTNIISLSDAFSQSIMSQVDCAGDNVRLAASRLQEYLNH